MKLAVELRIYSAIIGRDRLKTLITILLLSYSRTDCIRLLPSRYEMVNKNFESFIWFSKVSTSIKEIYFKFLSIVLSQDDHDRVKVIETLSKKLEELFEEHFASWDFDNISGSPRESSPVLHRFKTAGQKPVTGRYGNTKKCQSSSITENI